MPKLSRRKLAIHTAARLAAGEDTKTVLRQLAAYLIDSGRKAEASLVVRDTESMLMDAGTAIGTVTSARPLSPTALKAIESFVMSNDSKIKTVLLREEVDESLISGMKLELPGVQLDASVKAKLMKITA